MFNQNTDTTPRNGVIPDDHNNNFCVNIYTNQTYKINENK